MTRSTLRAAALVPALALVLAGCGSVVGGGGGAGSSGDLPVLRIGVRAGAGGAAGGGPAPDDPYPLVGALPTGPTSAAVHRYGTAPVADPAVLRLAVALGLSGSAVRHAHGVEIASTTGALRVRDGGTWSYARSDEQCPAVPVDIDAADPASIGVGCGVAPGSGTAPPAAPADPAALAAPILAAAGLGAAAPQVQTYAGESTVSVDPTLDGAAVRGTTTAVVVDADGVASAYGVLGEPALGPTYPLISAAQALDVLRAQPQPEIAISCAIGQVCPGLGPHDVSGASLGLSSAWDGAEQVLVPTWLFDIVGSTVPAAVVAVADRYLADPGTSGSGSGSGSGAVGGGSGSAIPPQGSSSPGSSSPGAPEPPPATDLPLPLGTATSFTVTSYSESRDGTALVLRTEGGVCTDYRGSAVETGRTVTVSITGTPNRPTDAVCPAIAKLVEVTVGLTAPLAGRAVVGARTGRPVPLG